MKTATANFKSKANLPQGTQSVILAKIFYGTSSFFLCSTRKVTIGTDIYKPYVEEFGTISYAVNEAPGLGSQSTCEIILKRKIFAESGGGTENTAENLLTQKSKGKQILLWQFFDDTLSPVLGDSDKLPLGIFIIDEVLEIKGGKLKLRCISPEVKIDLETPKLKLEKTTFPNLLEDNLGLTRPIVFGNFPFPFNTTPVGMNEKEYIACQRPIHVPIPIYLTDIYDFIFLVHEAPDAIDLTSESGENLELFEWFPEWNLYAFCRRIDGNNKVWAASNSSGRTSIDMNALYNITNHGRLRYLRILPAEPHYNNGATEWKNAIDLDETTKASIPASTNLMVTFDEKSALSECIKVAWKICFYVSAVNLGGGANIDVSDGIIGGAENIRGNFGTTGFKEISSATLTDTAISQGYYLKIAVGAGQSCTINGLHIKLEFNSNKRPFATFNPGRAARTEKIGRGMGPYFERILGPITRHYPGIAPEWISATGLNNYFFNGRGLVFDTDTKGYNYENPVYFIQYLLRKIAGYASTEIQYTSFNQTHDWLTKDSGPAGEFTFWKFAGSLNISKSASAWLEDILTQSLCWLYWGGESGWHLFPINYASQITGILTFSDTDSIRPILKNTFKLYRSRYIYNKFVFDIDFDYASGKFREEIVFDQANKTELATSVTDYGEIIYPIKDYTFIHNPEFSITSSTNATPIVVTVSGHRFSNGDKILFRGHTVNSNANGVWTIANVTTNTFELSGSTGNGIGGATGTVCNLTSGKSSQVNNLYSVLRRAWKDPRWIVEFETRLSMSWLEVGDNFRINHPAASGITGNGGATLNDNTDFQIIEWRQNGNRIFVKAVEVVP